MLKYALFDLDGTISKSGIGIKNSIRYALNKFGVSAFDEGKLDFMIGPPLVDGFMQYFGLSKEDAITTTAYYREYYSVKGKFETEIYDGVKELLKDLKERGVKLIVCTSKPQGFTEEILTHFGLDKIFHHVLGATLDGKLGEKDEIIALAIEKFGIEKDSAVMVGDRKFDIEGANKNGIKGVGVSYGYGTRTELTNAGAFAVAKSAVELKEILYSL